MPLLIMGFLLLCLPAFATASVDYQLELRLDPAGQQLQGNATLLFEEGPVNNVALRLSERCEILEISQGGSPLAYRFSSGRLTLQRIGPEPLLISYRGRFADAVPEQPVHNEDPGYGVSATITPKGTYLSGGVAWYPQLDEQDIRYRLDVITPPGIEAVTSGRRVAHQAGSDRVQSSWLIDYPLYSLTLSAGAYRVFEELRGRVPIYAYFYPESAELAGTYLAAARNYLELYEERFGPYPFHKFAIVENFFPTGYGLPSWTLLGSSVIALPFIVQTSLGHEIAHSWWGTGVRVDYRQGNWCEGLTTYVADYLYKERQSPEEASEYRLKTLSDYASLVNERNTFPLDRFRSRYDKASQAIGYGKAMMLFHMLRQEVGDETFWASLRKIADRDMFRTIGWDRFVEVFSSAAGRDLQGFFNQWLERTEGPRLVLENAGLSRDDSGWRITGRLRQSGPVYDLNIPARISAGRKNRMETVHSNAADTEFTWHVAQRPDSLEIDPDADVFRILAPEEIPSTVNSIRGSTRLLALQAEQGVPPANARQMLLGGLRKNDLKIQPVSEVDAELLGRYDLLIFGTPEQLLPPGITTPTAGGEISFAGRQLSLGAHSLFIVGRNPFNADRHAAWFISGDKENAAIVARKIPHYGKYSDLLFEGTTNRVKELSRPQHTPMRMEFPLSAGGS